MQPLVGWSLDCARNNKEVSDLTIQFNFNTTAYLKIVAVRCQFRIPRSHILLLCAVADSGLQQGLQRLSIKALDGLPSLQSNCSCAYHSPRPFFPVLPCAACGGEVSGGDLHTFAHHPHESQQTVGSDSHSGLVSGPGSGFLDDELTQLQQQQLLQLHLPLLPWWQLMLVKFLPETVVDIQSFDNYLEAQICTDSAVSSAEHASCHGVSLSGSEEDSSLGFVTLSVTEKDLHRSL